MLELGIFIPDFTAPDQDGNIVSSAELLGKKTVVYFYPKASTPGCTAEACSLRDNYDRFLAAGYNVVGISRDSVKAQKNFSDKNALPFPPTLRPRRINHQGFWRLGRKETLR